MGLNQEESSKKLQSGEANSSNKLSGTELNDLAVSSNIHSATSANTRILNELEFQLYNLLNTYNTDSHKINPTVASQVITYGVVSEILRGVPSVSFDRLIEILSEEFEGVGQFIDEINQNVASLIDLHILRSEGQMLSIAKISGAETECAQGSITIEVLDVITDHTGLQFVELQPIDSPEKEEQNNDTTQSDVSSLLTLDSLSKAWHEIKELHKTLNEMNSEINFLLRCAGQAEHGKIYLDHLSHKKSKLSSSEVKLLIDYAAYVDFKSLNPNKIKLAANYINTLSVGDRLGIAPSKILSLNKRDVIQYGKLVDGMVQFIAVQAPREIYKHSSVVLEKVENLLYSSIELHSSGEISFAQLNCAIKLAQAVCNKPYDYNDYLLYYKEALDGFVNSLKYGELERLTIDFMEEPNNEPPADNGEIRDLFIKERRDSAEQFVHAISDLHEYVTKLYHNKDYLNSLTTFASDSISILTGILRCTADWDKMSSTSKNKNLGKIARVNIVLDEFTQQDNLDLRKLKNRVLGITGAADSKCNILITSDLKYSQCDIFTIKELIPLDEFASKYIAPKLREIRQILSDLEAHYTAYVEASNGGIWYGLRGFSDKLEPLQRLRDIFNAIGFVRQDEDCSSQQLDLTLKMLNNLLTDEGYVEVCANIEILHDHYTRQRDLFGAESQG